MGKQEVTYVLDACALIALLKQENGFEKVRDMINSVDDNEADVYISIINLLEVYYGFISSDGIEDATRIIEKIYNSSIQIVDTISQTVYQHAARLKGTYKRISLADSIGLATAIEKSCHFVTSDHHELELIEQKEAIKFYWFR
ncbi:MAG: PIN domain-containing protein [Treponema sp.]|jgi:predicted nucleic acid-binding protein|nr:PIN domain-containing protein [Treponema sp.]